MARHVLLRYRPRLLYLNTVKSACYVRSAISLGIPTILHVHELDPLLSQTLGRYRLGAAVYRQITLVACSDAVRTQLSAVTGVARDDIKRLRSVPDQEFIRRDANAHSRRVSPNRLRVGACAAANHGKGVDLWLRMARALLDRRGVDDVDFVWIGEPPKDDVMQLVQQLGLSERVTFPGAVANPYPDISAFDVFTLPSRADAFPLVVVEAMHLARPVVAFDVGGVREQLGDTGVLVPPSEYASMASAVDGLLRDEARRRRLGQAAADRAEATLSISNFRLALLDLIGTAPGKVAFPADP